MNADVSRETSSGKDDALRAALTPLHDILATDAVTRGLIGPREVPRLWDRHLMNCAVVEELIPAHASVADVGSGAGLPGLVLAVARPDLTLTLIEPLARRDAFLREAVQRLDLGDRVEVVRARAEEVRQTFDVVTARAVAPLDRLCGWCLALVRPGGSLLALKGERAAEELAQASPALPRDAVSRVVQCGVGRVDPPTTVVVVDMAGSVTGSS